MTEHSDIYANLSEIFDDVFMRNMKLSPEMSTKTVPDWDSFKQVEIIISVEQKFDFKFTTRELDGLKCLRDLVGVIAARRSMHLPC